MSRHEDSGCRSQWLGHDGLLVVVVHGPSFVSSSNFENMLLAASSIF